jgi:hypothetical protein
MEENGQSAAPYLSELSLTVACRKIREEKRAQGA